MEFIFYGPSGQPSRYTSGQCSVSDSSGGGQCSLVFTQATYKWRTHMSRRGKTVIHSRGASPSFPQPTSPPFSSPNILTRRRFSGQFPVRLPVWPQEQVCIPIPGSAVLTRAEAPGMTAGPRAPRRQHRRREVEGHGLAPSVVPYFHSVLPRRAAMIPYAVYTFRYFFHCKVSVLS